jgi:hypothetical protein
VRLALELILSNAYLIQMWQHKLDAKLSKIIFSTCKTTPFRIKLHSPDIDIGINKGCKAERFPIMRSSPHALASNMQSFE